VFYYRNPFVYFLQTIETINNLPDDNVFHSKPSLSFHNALSPERAFRIWHIRNAIQQTRHVIKTINQLIKFIALHWTIQSHSTEHILLNANTTDDEVQHEQLPTATV